MDAWIAGPIAGALANGVMTALEAPARRRRGAQGVLDWERNQSVAARLLHRPAEDLVAAGLVIHLSHGIGAGLILAILLPGTLSPLATVAAGLGWGALRWVVTVLLHAPVTHHRIRGDRARETAAVVSLASNLAYGLVLGALLTVL